MVDIHKIWCLSDGTSTVYRIKPAVARGGAAKGGNTEATRAAKRSAASDERPGLPRTLKLQKNLNPLTKLKFCCMIRLY